MLGPHFSSASCAGGTVPSTPAEGLSGRPCSPGHFCPLGMADPTPCPPGSYASGGHTARCHICPGGHHCVPGLRPQLCPRGQCPAVAWLAGRVGTVTRREGNGPGCGGGHAPAFTVPGPEPRPAPRAFPLLASPSARALILAPPASSQASTALKARGSAGSPAPRAPTAPCPACAAGRAVTPATRAGSARAPTPQSPPDSAGRASSAPEVPAGPTRRPAPKVRVPPPATEPCLVS